MKFLKDITNTMDSAKYMKPERPFDSLYIGGADPEVGPRWKDRRKSRSRVIITVRQNDAKSHENTYRSVHGVDFIFMANISLDVADGVSPVSFFIANGGNQGR